MSTDGTVVFLNSYSTFSLYKSTDGGNTVAAITTPANIMAVACDATCTKVLGATSDKDSAPTPAAALYVSTNGGTSWGSAISATGHVGGVAVSSDGSVMAASVYNVGVYLSVNGGSTWSMKAPATLTLTTFYSVALSNSGNVVAVYGGNTLPAQISIVRLSRAPPPTARAQPGSCAHSYHLATPFFT
jgi:photosystem II stability/assembly factor-like uncharacterized protein